MEPIEVKAVSLQYEMDSKGYYQPMYHFEVLNHNQAASIWIPAIPQGIDFKVRLMKFLFKKGFNEKSHDYRLSW